MLRFRILLLSLCFSLSLFAQDRIASIVQQREVQQDYYELEAAGAKVLYLPMEYGKSVFTTQQEAVIRNLQHAVVARVDLVYSDFPAGADFSALTRKRLAELKKLMPVLFTGNAIEFRLVRQTIAKNREVAASLEHGFFIYFRPTPTREGSRKERSKLTELLHPGSATKTKAGTDSIPFWCWQSTITTDTATAVMLPLPEGATRTVSRVAVRDAVKQGYLLKDQEKEYLNYGDSCFLILDRRDEDCVSDDGSYVLYDLADSTVSQVFRRHRWGGAFVVADVTGSMYPYAGQLLKWLQLNLAGKEKKHFLFFNDGDDKSDEAKVIGSTGGLYSAFTGSYDEVEKTLLQAMEKGSGGDAPENNIEALIEAERLCSDCDSVVLIADNWAPVKDLSLLTRYHKPVKVVLCGVLGRINKDYLKLARDTGGSLHLMEEDIYTLSNLKEGETIRIHGVLYKLVRGEFLDITPKTS